jgi:hypothetical protein
MPRGKVVKRVDQMAPASRRPGYPKRRQGLLKWTRSRKPNYNMKSGSGLDGYKLDEDKIILL